MWSHVLLAISRMMFSNFYAKTVETLVPCSTKVMQYEMVLMAAIMNFHGLVDKRKRIKKTNNLTQQNFVY